MLLHIITETRMWRYTSIVRACYRINRSEMVWTQSYEARKRLVSWLNGC